MVSLVRSGKRRGKSEIVEKGSKEKLKMTKEESAMNDAILEELKSLRNDLTKQMQKISGELTNESINGLFNPIAVQLNYRGRSRHTF